MDKLENPLMNEEGMTLLDYFAGQALTGAMAEGEWGNDVEALECVASYTYRVAEAMLQERQKWNKK